MPPLSRLVKIQLVVVLLLGLVASAYGGIRYARMDQAVGVGVYRVTVEMPEAGGLFPEAQVTYRGVAAGRVRDLRMTDTGIDVDLVLESSGEQIPASAVAVVANRSAIGEQFLDLQPESSDGPFLHEGSRIDASHVRFPPKLEEVTRAAIDLTKTVPVDDLRITVTELGKAFNGQGDNLTRLVDSLDKLSQTGVERLDDTIELIKNSRPVLRTQAEQSDEILSWSKNLDLVASTLASSDPAVRRILTDGPRAASALSAFLDSNGSDATTLIHQLGSTVHAVEPASFVTGMTFAMLSSLSASSHTTSSLDGQIRFGIVLETGNPPSCTQGYESTQRMIDEIKARNPDFDVNYDDFPFNTKAGCTVPTGNPTAVRGANNADLSNPAFTQPWDSKPKRDPDKLNLNPLANQLAGLMGVRTR
ncbi:ABC transporter substrate-binding protein [Gordonia spumicola]|uniref:ABC transporter substrate-binding protein n=1 Tax=Gordonia spumicola TaxID=589161 RepID=A0A7I9VFP7_9ACTN|nr:MCE family protein [Gordonia spumicola]GEE03933.1 ABC transporter substrate-binding protein [Gordonia spumicola]